MKNKNNQGILPASPYIVWSALFIVIPLLIVVFFSFTVKSGDTLWDIASRSTASNVDVREVVHTVKELNNISDSGNLTPGTKIKVPVYKTDSPTRAMDYMAQN